MGIDYGNGTTNVSDIQTPKGESIRYGVIHQHEVLQAWSDSSESYYGNPHCPKCGTELDPDIDDGHMCDCGYTIEWIGEECYGDPLSYYINSDDYKAESDSEGDIFVLDSPYYTRCGYCSPCAPGAGYLTDRGNDCNAFCFGPEWFDGDCPYPVWRVSDGFLVDPGNCE